jgi:hypothetical protein
MGNLINQSCHDETDKLASIQTMRSAPHQKPQPHSHSLTLIKGPFSD